MVIGVAVRAKLHVTGQSHSDRVPPCKIHTPANRLYLYHLDPLESIALNAVRLRSPGGSFFAHPSLRNSLLLLNTEDQRTIRQDIHNGGMIRK